MEEIRLMYVVRLKRRAASKTDMVHGCLILYVKPIKTEMISSYPVSFPFSHVFLHLPFGKLSHLEMCMVNEEKYPEDVFQRVGAKVQISVK